MSGLRCLTAVGLILLFTMLFVKSTASAPWKAPDSTTPGATFDHWSIKNSDFLGIAFPTNKVGYLISRAGEILKTDDAGQSWTLKLSSQPYLSAISFINEVEGWVVGSDGRVLHTEDSGDSWHEQNTLTDNTLYAVSFKDSNSGWAVGDRGVVLKTHDGGKRWDLIETQTDSRLQSVAFLDGDHGWAVGSRGTVLRTDDGGATWIKTTIGQTDLFSVDFKGNRGVAVGTSGQLFYTTNSGQSWSTVTLNREITLYAVHLVDTNGGWAAGSDGYLYQISFGIDGKIAWNQIESNARSSIRSLIGDRGQAWATGAEGLVLNLSSTGQWVRTMGKDPTTGTLNSMLWRSEKDGWITTSTGRALHTQDGGSTWETILMPWPAAVPVAERSLNSMAFSQEHGWAVGSKGAIFASADGGYTWTLQDSTTQSRLLSVSAPSDLAAWAVGTGGTILHTIDGKTWAPVKTEETGVLTAAFFVGPNHGWIAGHGGLILATSDGITFRRQYRESNLQLRTLYLIDGKYGWAAGANGVLLTTTNGEKWRRGRRIVPRHTITSLRFISKTRGWAVDDAGEVHFTDDGGVRWRSQDVTGGRSLTSVFFLNPDFAWIAGRDVVAKLTWRQLPALVEFDAVNTLNGVELSGTIAKTNLSIWVTKIEYQTSGSTQHQTLTGRLPVKGGHFNLVWNPHDSGYRDGTSFNYTVYLTDGGYDYSQIISTPFIYRNWFWQVTESYPWIIPTTVIVILLLSILMIPSVLFVFYRYLPWKAASDLFGGGAWAKVAASVCSLVVIPLFFKLPWVTRAWAKRYAIGKMQLSDLGAEIRSDYLKRDSVLDAWVTRHLGSASTDFSRIVKQASENGSYIPMPITLDDNKIDIPLPRHFSWMFDQNAFKLVITGSGGAGKTVFSVQLGLWALEGHPQTARGAMIPVFIRQQTDNLLLRIKEILLPIVVYDEDLDEALISRLISRKRLLIIVDSLSEWGESERKYIEGIYGRMQVGALVVTSRRAVEYTNARTVTIGTLDTSSMFRFREQYLQNRQFLASRDFIETLDHGLLDIQNQWFDGAQPTCMLVRMYIDDALDRLRPPLNLAGNAPDVILRYVQRLTGVDFGDSVITIAKQTARETLGDSFVPAYVSRTSLIQKLDEQLKMKDVTDSLEKLEKSGLIDIAFIAGSIHLKFVHDPVAEFLASISVCEEYKKRDELAWLELVEKVKEVESEASGFVFALQASLNSYRAQLGLPKFMQYT